MLNRQVGDALKAPDVRQLLREAGIEPESSSVAGARTYFLQQRERERVTRVAHDLNISLMN